VAAGATCSSNGHGKGITNVKDGDGSVTTVGCGANIKAKFVGDMPFETTNGVKGTMGDIEVIPGAPFNLISGTKLLTMGYKISGDQDKIVYSKRWSGYCL
jgi:hypothetical protein